jgi:uncharacterized protein (TIGR03435 family)
VSDMELLQAYLRRGSQEAFAALVQRHINLVYSAALRHTGIATHAEEITQAVFITFVRKAASLREHTALEGWFYETTRLTALSFLRGERRRQFREQEAYMQSTLQDSADNSIWNQLAPLLDEAMFQLRKKDRDAVVLRFFKDKNISEVAAALDVTEAAAQRRVLRAVDKLRKIFAKNGFTLSAALIAGAVSAKSVQAAPVGLAKTISVAALTKGAASGSTLTLVKGALKIMAWTKVKTAIVVSAGVLLAAGTTTVAVKEVKSSHNNAIFEQIWAQQAAGISPMNALIHAPPALIVRPTHYSTAVSGGFWTDARIGHGFNVNLPGKYLVMGAYQVGPWRAVFLNDPPGGGFDVMETLPPGQNEPALRREIQKRFGLVGHTEMREADALQLVVKDSTRLNPCVSRGGPAGVIGRGNGNQPMQLVLQNQTLKEVAGELESYFRQPVVEPGEFADHYDLTFQVDYKLGGDTLQQSFRNQLDRFGLELVPTNMPIEMLVVEKAP